MTEQEAEDLFVQINAMLRDRGLTWLASEIVGEAAEGRASPKILTVQEHLDVAFTLDETPPRRTRRQKSEFTHVRPLTSKEKLGVAINALRSIIASSANMLPEVMHTLNAGNGMTISFASETDVPTIVVSQADASRYSSAAVELDRRLQALIKEVSSGS
jgi:hypothetical protein